MVVLVAPADMAATIYTNKFDSWCPMWSPNVPEVRVLVTALLSVVWKERESQRKRQGFLLTCLPCYQILEVVVGCKVDGPGWQVAEYCWSKSSVQSSDALLWPDPSKSAYKPSSFREMFSIAHKLLYPRGFWCYLLCPCMTLTWQKPLLGSAAWSWPHPVDKWRLMWRDLLLRQRSCASIDPTLYM